MKPRKNPEVLAREEEGGRHLMFNRTSQLSLILNHTSYFIWDVCDGSRDIEEIVEFLKQRYDTAATDLTDPQLSEVVGEHLSLLQRTDLLMADSSTAS